MSKKKTLLLSHRNKAHDLWGHKVSLNIFQGGCWGKEQPSFNIYIVQDVSQIISVFIVLRKMVRFLIINRYF